MNDEIDEANRPGLDAATQAIRAIHGTGGVPLSKQETIDFITRPFYLGPPELVKRDPRGRKRKTLRTQYEEAFDRRKNLYRKLVKNPKARLGSRTIDQADIERRFAELKERKVPAHKWVREIRTSLEHEGKPICDESTLRRFRRAWMRENT